MAADGFFESIESRLGSIAATKSICSASWILRALKPPTSSSGALFAVRDLDAATRGHIVFAAPGLPAGYSNLRADQRLRPGTILDLGLTKDGHFEYLVRTGGPLLENTASHPPGSSGDFHPTLVKLQSSLTQPPGGAEPDLPQYVFQLGQLYVKDMAVSSTAPDFQVTNYVVVVDATAPKKSLWLVYDYNPENNLLGERGTAELSDQADVFPGVKTDFDVAQMVASLQEWNDSLTVRAVEASISRTGRVVRPYRGTVDYSEVAAAIRQGWRS